jgi:hypothetical protein
VGRKAAMFPPGGNWLGASNFQGLGPLLVAICPPREPADWSLLDWVVTAPSTSSMDPPGGVSATPFLLHRS